MIDKRPKYCLIDTSEVNVLISAFERLPLFAKADVREWEFDNGHTLEATTKASLNEPEWICFTLSQRNEASIMEILISSQGEV